MSRRINNAERIAARRQDRIAAGLVSEHFPQISSIVIRMIYYQKGPNNVLMHRTINILPTSYAYFRMDCMIRDCSNGGFDLTPLIIDMIMTMKRTKRGNMICNGKISSNSLDHASIDYDIAIKYNKD